MTGTSYADLLAERIGDESRYPMVASSVRPYRVINPARPLERRVRPWEGPADEDASEWVVRLLSAGWSLEDLEDRFTKALDWKARRARVKWPPWARDRHRHEVARACLESLRAVLHIPPREVQTWMDVMADKVTPFADRRLVEFVDRWRLAAGRLAPLAWAADFTIEDAAEKYAAGTLDEGALAFLVAMQQDVP